MKNETKGLLWWQKKVTAERSKQKLLRIRLGTESPNASSLEWPWHLLANGSLRVRAERKEKQNSQKKAAASLAKRSGFACLDDRSKNCCAETDESIRGSRRVAATTASC